VSPTIWFLFLWVISVVIGTIIGESKGRAGAGFGLSFVLGLLGVIIIAVLPPTEEKLAERNEQLAYAVRAGIPAPVVAPPQSPQVQVQEPDRDLRRWATAQALSRDPSLGDSQDPATLERLRLAVDQILIEKQTLDDLNAVKAEMKASSDDEWRAKVLDGPIREDLLGDERVQTLTDEQTTKLWLAQPPDRAEGWYLDPLTKDRARWWNGADWTGQERPLK